MLSRIRFFRYKPSAATKVPPAPKRPPLLRRSSSRRVKYTYDDNHSAALKLPFTDAELNRMHGDNYQLLHQVKPYILEHAARRVDLFFYCALALYKSGLMPTKGHTRLQHGSGRNAITGQNITQGCHSSFFGTIVDGPHNCFSGTHFASSLNMTMELPWFVNKLDDALEELLKGRKKAIAILQGVAQSRMTPVQALADFLKLMVGLHHEIKERNLKAVPDEIEDELTALSLQGTTINKWDMEKEVLNLDYVELLLRLTPEEKANCLKDGKERDAIYEAKYIELYNEIISSQASILPGWLAMRQS